jgi:hypothetical protein
MKRPADPTDACSIHCAVVDGHVLSLDEYPCDHSTLVLAEQGHQFVNDLHGAAFVVATAGTKISPKICPFNLSSNKIRKLHTRSRERSVEALFELENVPDHILLMAAGHDEACNYEDGVLAGVDSHRRSALPASST